MPWCKHSPHLAFLCFLLLFSPLVRIHMSEATVFEEKGMPVNQTVVRPAVGT
jgi:hypothetical protein